MDTQISPRQLVDELLEMAREYERIMSQLTALRVKRATSFITIRAGAGVKSDKQADRIWEASADGINELTLAMKAKGIEKLMSAIKTKLRALEGERFNQY